MKHKPIVKKNNIVVQEMNKELMVYDLSINKAYCLNETSALVYQMADGAETVSQIADLMSAKLKTPVSNELVWLTIAELEKSGLLENAGQTNDNPLAGMSRREAVRKVGLATMVALPVISSLVAPTAAAAQSCLSYQSDCSTATSSCCSGLFCNENGSSNCCVREGLGREPDGSFLYDCLAAGQCEDIFNVFCCSGRARVTGIQGSCVEPKASPCYCAPYA